LLPHFLAVLNTGGDRDGLIRHGNERVLRARFSDARFFWQTDQKQTLRERVELLKHVTFQKDLGSYYDKTIRVQRLASWLAETVKQSGLPVRPGVVHKAALLAKADLTAELVKEFTELQGIVGGLYAAVQTLDDDLKPEVQAEIAKAIYDHYKPESMEDEVPRTVEGAVLSIADKADSIAGMFALGLIPSGSKDPFALRRQANGIVKTIAEHKFPFRLSEVMRDARARYQDSEAEKKFSNAAYEESVRSFFRERVEFYLKDARGFPYDIVKAVLSAEDLSQVLYEHENRDFSGFDLPIGLTDRRFIQISDISDDVAGSIQRVDAIAAYKANEDFLSVLTAFKRTRNILVQALEKKYFVGPFIPVLASEREAKLHDDIMEAGAGFSNAIKRDNYRGALDLMVRLKPKIDSYFNEILVMADDEIIRRIRLGFLAELYRQFRKIADFSEIVTEGKS